jgi:hypothetical protein
MQKHLREIVLHLLVTSACCIILGMFLYQGNVFSRTHYAFQFLTSGIAGSMFFHTLRLTNAKTAVLALGVLIVMLIVYDRSFDIWWKLRDLLLGVSLGSAIYLFNSNFYTRNKARGVMTPLTLGALLAATNLIAMFALVLFGASSLRDSTSGILVNVVLGFFVGFGIGVGILVSRSPVARLSTQPE